MSKRIIVVGILVVFVGLAGLYILQSDDLNTEWKTYRDEEYGFEMQYPPEWTPQFIEGQFAGFYDKSYVKWLENFDESARVTPGIKDFESIQEEFMKQGEKKPTLPEYVDWLLRRTEPSFDAEPLITETRTADGRAVIRAESYSSIAPSGPGIYIEMYVPIADGEVYVFTTSKKYAAILDEIISTLKFF
jgi:hypothetical protein